jgi:hypothetical protein
MSKRHKTAAKAVEPEVPTKQIIRDYICTIDPPITMDFDEYDTDELIEDLSKTIALLRQAQSAKYSKLCLRADAGAYHLSGERLETDEEFADRLEMEREKQAAAALREANRQEDQRQDLMQRKLWLAP